MIIVTGSLAFDFIMDFPGKFADQIVPEKIHLINLSFLVNTLREGNGGTAGNIALNLALLGQKVAILSSAGKDFSPYKLFLKKNKVETKFINIVKSDFTARAFITTDLSDNQITGFYPGAIKYNEKLKIKNVKLQLKSKKDTPIARQENIEMVVISPDDPQAMSNYVKECINLNLPFMFDPGMQLPRLSNEVLKRGIIAAQIIIGNDYEMEIIEKRIGKSSLAKKIHDRVKKVYIRTLGEKGSEIRVMGGKDALIKIPAAKPKEVLDPTGAGDAYRAGFLAGYLRNLPLSVCGRMGSLASVYTVEKYGTTTHKFTIKEFCKRYKENFKEELNL